MNRWNNENKPFYMQTVCILIIIFYICQLKMKLMKKTDTYIILSILSAIIILLNKMK